MDILVCIKQVPGSTNVQVDPETGVLKRDSQKGKLNPYDLFALELAFSLRERVGGTVTALTMGPAQAERALLECLYMGADRALLLCDRRFAGADVLATSRALSAGIRRAGPFDLIVCGTQTTDGDTAQVGAEIAELLDIPHACNVREISPAGSGQLMAETVLEREILCVRMSMPCLVTAEKDINTPRLPSFVRKMAASDKAVELLTLDDLPDRDERLYGLTGSATQVERIFPPDNETVQEHWAGPNAELAEKLYAFLLDATLIER